MIYREIATRVWDGVRRAREGGRPPPRIVIE